MESTVRLLPALALLLALTLVPARPAAAQESRPRPLPPPAMFDESGERARPLDLNSVQVEVRILGSVARTTMTLGFGNPGSRAVAGNLYFPLPPQATVSGYALDIKGQMVDGVVVPKDTGRQVYQTVMARGIDPGIVEWTQGNVFKTRVFPVPANGSRLVRLSWLCPVGTDAEGQTFRLPLDFPKPVAEFRLSIEVAKSAVRPVISEGGREGLAFSGWRDGWRADFKASQADLSRDLVIRLPRVEANPLKLEKSAGGTVYFSWFGPSDELKGPSAGQASASGRDIVPRAVTLYWDASASRAPARHDLVIASLEAAFQRWNRAGAAAVKVSLVSFRDRPDSPRSFTVRNGDLAELAAGLRALPYDGASRLAALPAPAAGCDLAILVSDGMATLGPVELPPLAIPLYVLSADARLNPGRLAGLAAASGGAWIPVTGAREAGARIGRADFRFIGATVLSGRLGEVLPVPGSPEGLCGINGRLDSAKARVSLKFGWGARVSREITLDLDSAEAQPAAVGDSLLDTLWAQARLARLLADPEADSPALQAETAALGREFGLVTPGTSLIVLESLAQYVEFRIRPPASLGELRGQYDRQTAEIDRQGKEQKRGHLDQVMAQWQERLVWWDTVFSYPKDYRYQETSRNKAMAEESREDRSAQDAAPASPSVAGAANGADFSRAPAPQAEAADKKEASGDAGRPAAEARVSIKPWTPDTPYLRELAQAAGVKPPSLDESPAAGGFRLDDAAAARAYQRYLAIRPQWDKAPSFFLDVGDFFERGGQRGLAIRTWSNLAEMDLENPAVLRILGYRWKQAGESGLAVLVFEQVLRMRREEPQSYRDLALALADAKDYTRALDLLWQVVSLPELTGPDGRQITWDKTPGVEIVALTELNALLPKARAAKAKLPDIDPRLVRLLDTDIRIVLTWDTDLSDMDLWVIEPSGEKAFYGHRQTRIGGMVSNDITTGYGPEEYLIRKAMKGSYTIMANFFGSGNPELGGAVTLQAEIITDFGRPGERRQSMTLRLSGSRESYTVGTVSF